MPMKFPIVSRDRYDEMKQMLSKRVEELDELNRRLTDRLITQMSGAPMFEQPTQVVKLPKQPKTELEQALRMTGGSVRPSRLSRAFSAIRAVKRNPGAMSPVGMNPAAAKVSADFDAAVEEGRQSVAG